jgi:hypothetical protein
MSWREKQLRALLCIHCGGPRVHNPEFYVRRNLTYRSNFCIVCDESMTDALRTFTYQRIMEPGWRIPDPPEIHRCDLQTTARTASLCPYPHRYFYWPHPLASAKTMLAYAYRRAAYTPVRELGRPATDSLVVHALAQREANKTGQQQQATLVERALSPIAGAVGSSTLAADAAASVSLQMLRKRVMSPTVNPNERHFSVAIYGVCAPGAQYGQALPRLGDSAMFVASAPASVAGMDTPTGTSTDAASIATIASVAKRESKEDAEEAGEVKQQVASPPALMTPLSSSPFETVETGVDETELADAKKLEIPFVNSVAFAERLQEYNITFPDEIRKSVLPPRERLSWEEMRVKEDATASSMFYYHVKATDVCHGCNDLLVPDWAFRERYGLRMVKHDDRLHHVLCRVCLETLSADQQACIVAQSRGGGVGGGGGSAPSHPASSSVAAVTSPTAHIGPPYSLVDAAPVAGPAASRPRIGFCQMVSQHAKWIVLPVASMFVRLALEEKAEEEEEEEKAAVAPPFATANAQAFVPPAIAQ